MKKIFITLGLITSVLLTAAEFSNREIIQKARELIQVLQRNDGVLTEREENKIYRHLQAALEIASSGGSDYESEADAKSLMLAAVRNVSSVESKTKILNKAIVYLNDSNLLRLKRACDPTSNWNDNANCLIKGIQEMRGTVYISEGTAKQTTLLMCVETKTWNDEVNCFETVIRTLNNSYIDDAVVGCRSISHLESRSKCYRNSLSEAK